MNQDSENKTVVNGLHAYRLSEDNPRESAFAEQWNEEQERGLLNGLFNVRCGDDDPEGHRSFNSFGGKTKRPIGDPTERDRIVAATVIQWLGSNVGMGFLHEVCRKCGYTLTTRKP